MESRGHSLSWKILLAILPLLLLALGISVVVQNRFQEAEMMDQAQTSAYTYADILRESLVSMMVNNGEVDTTFLEKVRSIQQFDSLRILTNDLRLRFELLPEEQVRRIQRKHRVEREAGALEAAVLRNGSPVFRRTGDEFQAVIPFNATSVCRECHNVPLHYTLGAADIRFSLERFSQAAAGNWRRSIVIFLVFTVVAIGVAAVVFRRYVSSPIGRLVGAAAEIQKGNLDRAVPLAPGGSASRDELGYLAERFEAMRGSLAQKIDELDRANRDLSRRNADVEEALRQLRRAQEELVRNERLAATGRMAAQLSHEINNPIHNTRSLLESSLRRMDENDEARELISLALEETSRMAGLTRQMLDLHRGSVVEADLQMVDLRLLLDDLRRTHVDSLRTSGIAFEVDVPADLPRIQGIPDKLRQVFLNLLLNAKDAMPSGGRIRIRGALDGPSVVLTVSDTGAGILPEHRDRIFDAFFTTKKAVAGVGLGLSVTHGIIQQHHGTIAVESAVGAGTTFTITLPVPIVEAHRA